MSWFSYYQHTTIFGICQTAKTEPNGELTGSEGRQALAAEYSDRLKATYLYSIAHYEVWFFPKLLYKIRLRGQSVQQAAYL